MAITIDTTAFISPPITGTQFWRLVASDGDRVVAMRDFGGGPQEFVATFHVSDPFVWSVHATPVAFNRDLVVVYGDTIIANTGSGFSYSLDAGVSWATAVSGLEPTTCILQVGPDVVALGNSQTISTVDMSSPTSWTDIPTDLPAVSVNVRDMCFFDGYYYLACGQFNGSIFAARVYRSNNLANWALVFSEEAVLDAPCVLAMPGRIVIPRGGDSILTSEDGVTWDTIPALWGVSVGQGVVLDDGVAVLIAGSGFRASADGITWDGLNPGYPPAGYPVRYDGGVIAGTQVAESQVMGFSELTVPPPPVVQNWWKQLVNSTQEGE